MTTLWRALMAVVAVCGGELLLMLACFPMAAVGILPDSPAQGIQVPPLLLLIAAPIIWLAAFALLTAKHWEP